MFKKKAATGGEVNAFLGAGVEFEGKISFKGTVRLDGKFRGEIVTDDTLIVGEEGEVEAQISADVVIISGKVRGNVEAKSRLELHKPGALYGDVKTKNLVVTEGAIFNGRCLMGEEETPGPFEFPLSAE